MCVRVQFTRGTVQSQHLYFDRDNFFLLQCIKNTLYYAIFTPSFKSLVNAIPFAVFFWKRPPFAPVFGNIQDSVDKCVIVDFYIPTLNRKILFDSCVLFFCDIHVSIISYFEFSVNRLYKYVCFYTLAIYTGFRLGELMGLEWKDINFETNVITVNRTCLYSKAKGGLYTETPKTAQSLRSLKIPQAVIDMLVKWRSLQDIQHKKIGSQWIETDRIFTKWNGLTLDRSAPGYFFKQFCNRTGMRYVSNHSFRHLNASLLINSGIDVKTVQSCLGHSTATTTLQIYAHTFQSAQAAAMEAVAEALPLTCSDKAKTS